MNFDDFTALIEDRIMDYLPEDYMGASVEITETRKLNHTYTALIVKKEGQDIAASVDLDMLYDMLEDMSFEEVIKQAADMATRQPEGLDINSIQDYEKAREHLFIRVSSAEDNKDLLKDTPYKEILGLAVTCHVLVDLEDGEMGSTMVTGPLLDKFGVTTEQLFEDAFLNSQEILPPSIEPMEAMIAKMMGLRMETEVPETLDAQLENLDLEKMGMAVLTNRQAVNGAAVIFYPDLMAKIGDSQQVNFFILPSSTHEVILVPDNGSMKLKDLEDMVKSINASEVSPKDRLSDTVYHYDYKDRILEKGSDFEERVNGDKADQAEAPKVKHKKEKDWER